MRGLLNNTLEERSAGWLCGSYPVRSPCDKPTIANSSFGTGKQLSGDDCEIRVRPRGMCTTHCPARTRTALCEASSAFAVL
ncbi:hypothetical protein SAMN04487905_101270 [Actinopolyspora xinjiangensis]|uniref:Uncharacterized protein n=1 Tax=Actinopolyspora xinjiangensis TaxID=405564 RepID=A0A1H0NV30_9ACTN|nr:hypothetical protein SAMN04487905_101270 [Actinopolyspora xinjiangensis]